MKRIVLTIMAVAALAACTKSEVAYEAPAEIGFNVVAGNITKAVVDGTTYPTTLPMYVFAETMDNTAETPNYINDGLFVHKGAVEGTNVWGGSPNPYYWPNVKTLHFAGYSQAGNADGSYNCSTGVLSVTGYTPGTATGAGANDLMWFPTTELKVPAGYGKSTKFVPVDMYHTCAWITFIVKGDTVTGAGGYTVKSLTINNVDLTADVACSATIADEKIVPSIVWTNNTTQEENYAVPFKTATGVVLNTTGTNVETGDATTTSGNVVLVPQTAAKLTVVYSYNSSTGSEITETVDNLSLALTKATADATTATGPGSWEAGKHYIYTITIKANEILIAPTPVDWTDENWNVTVE